MNKFLHDLELSVRAFNVLSKAYPNITPEEFVALRKDDVMSLKNAGHRTWNEVRAIQEDLLAPKESKDATLCKHLVGMVNETMCQLDSDKYFLAIHKGYLVFVEVG